MSILVAASLPVTGEAQSWKPTRNVEIIAPSGAGGGSDEVARLVQRILHDRTLVEVTTAVVFAQPRLNEAYFDSLLIPPGRNGCFPSLPERK